MSAPGPTLPPAQGGGWGRVPLAAWIVVGVVGVHLLFFWAVSNRHFLPKTRYIPPAPTPNFGSRQTVTVDPHTGEKTVKSEFVVSTKLATPVPKATAK